MSGKACEFNAREVVAILECKRAELLRLITFAPTTILEAMYPVTVAWAQAHDAIRRERNE